MKKINDILGQIANSPTHEKLNTFLELKKFINILPLKLRSGVKFVYIKNDTMHFVLTHQLFKVEFEHNRNTLKEILNVSNIKNVNNFVFIVSHSINRSYDSKQDIDKSYKEKSVGIFDNNVKDEKLFRMFERIREIIKNNRELHGR